MMSPQEIELYIMMHCVSNTKMAKKDPVPELIISSVCSALNVSEYDVKSKSRKRELVDARFIAMLMLNEECNLHPSIIGELFNRDRTTAVVAIQTANILQGDAKFFAKTIVVQNQLKKDLL